MYPKIFGSHGTKSSPTKSRCGEIKKPTAERRRMTKMLSGASLRRDL
jgi:hypothetical protein